MQPIAPEPSFNHPNEPAQGNTLVVPSETTTIEEQFDAWYSTYPKKQGKAAAFKKFKRLPKHERQACIDAQPAWNEHWSREGNQFCPMASTWTSQQRWHDDIPVVTATRRLTAREQGMAAMKQRFQEQPQAATRQPQRKEIG